MPTTTVRLDDEDIRILSELSGLPEGVPFALKVRAVVQHLVRMGNELDEFRAILREELAQARQAS